MTRVHRRPLALACLTVLLALLPAGPAAAASADLWATVNICDTAASPNTIGIRASMPGNGTRQRLYMRFEVQYYDRVDRLWVLTGSTSRWLRVGSARYKSTQAGFSFQFAQPPLGEQFVMRGRVYFEWRARRGRPGRKRWVAVMKRRRITRAGILGVEGGVPPGRSEALCVVK